MREEAETAAAGARVRAERGREDIADEVGTVARHLQESASELRQRDAWLAGVLGRGADELDGLARSLKDRDLGDIVTSLDRFARRQPGLFMGAAVGLGFALTRLAKSSADRRHEEAPRTAPPVPPLATPSPRPSATPPAGRGYGQGGLA